MQFTIKSTSWWIRPMLAIKTSPGNVLNTWTNKDVKNTETASQRCSMKKEFLKVLQNSQENTWTGVSFLIKFQAETYNFIKKKILVQVFSCEFCEICKTTVFPSRTPPWLFLTTDISESNSEQLFMKMKLKLKMGTYLCIGLCWLLSQTLWQDVWDMVCNVTALADLDMNAEDNLGI